MNIGVTGGYGSGKSSISRVLAGYLGADLLNSDEICRQLLLPGGAAFCELEEIFGKRFICADGELDRDGLRQAAFSDSSVKKGLEGILHPLVRQHVAETASSCLKGEKHLVVEVPLLFEVGWQDDFNTTLLVRCSHATAVKRSVLRDNIQKEEAERVIALQMAMAEKERLAHCIVDNDGTFVSSVQQVAWFAARIRGSGSN